MPSVAKIILLGVFASIAPVIASPTPVDMAPRSYASGTSTCYYQCPSSTAAGDFTHLAHMNAYNTPHTKCYYGQFDAFCQYQDSNPLNDDGNTNCPRTLTVTCTTTGNPDSTKNFKREIAKRKLTAAERLIKSRQYKPKQASKA